ncbi:MAG: hypothetical protein ABW154_06105 [Dyella sp.]
MSAPVSVQGSDRWAPPAPTASVGYGSTRPLPGAQADGSFTFKSRGPQVPGQPPHALEDAQVGSMPSIQPDGRPALNCMQTPQDPKCR